MLKRIKAAFTAALTEMVTPSGRSATSVMGRMGQRGVSMTSYVIGIAVAALVVAIIIPIAFGQFFSTVTTSWDAQTILIWGIIPVIVILAIVLFFLNKADDQT